MSRLTKINELTGSGIITACNGKTCDKVCFSRCACEGCPIDEAIQKLAAYEYVEENARYCNCGDTKWYDLIKHIYALPKYCPWCGGLLRDGEDDG